MQRAQHKSFKIKSGDQSETEWINIEGKTLFLYENLKARCFKQNKLKVIL